MTAILVKNAERMITQVNLTDEAIEFTFADGVGGSIPLVELPGLTSASDISDVQLPNPYVLIVRSVSNVEIEIPWDFARGHSDPLYRPMVEAVARSGRAMIGARIRQLRESRGFTQAALARQAGISRVTMVRIENGEYSPRFETLDALARAFHRTSEQLVTHAPEPSVSDHAGTSITLADVPAVGAATNPIDKGRWKLGTSRIPVPAQLALAA